MSLQKCPSVPAPVVPPSVSLTSGATNSCGYVELELGGTMTPLQGRSLQFVYTLPYSLQHILDTYGPNIPPARIDIGPLMVSIDIYGAVELAFAGEPFHGPAMALRAGADFDFTVTFGSPTSVRPTTFCNAGREQWVGDFGPQQAAFETFLTGTYAVRGSAAVMAGGEPLLALVKLAGIECAAAPGTTQISDGGWALNPVQKVLALGLLVLLLLVVLVLVIRKGLAGGGTFRGRRSP